ncbi:MAG: hypothetical protein FWG66_06550 [Spirochaetes bacterium]|nr:hypothetical protein [Spirochaetota bacterium]
MAKKIKSAAGALAATLALALFVALPGAVYAQGFGLRNQLGELGLSTAAPPDAVLEYFGFGDDFWGSVIFEGISNAGDGGFVGWAVVEEAWGDLYFVMAWTGRNEIQADDIVFAAQSVFGIAIDRSYEDGVHFTEGGGWDVAWNPWLIEEGGYYLPAGTVLFWLSADND